MRIANLLGQNCDRFRFPADSMQGRELADRPPDFSGKRSEAIRRSIPRSEELSPLERCSVRA